MNQHLFQPYLSENELIQRAVTSSMVKTVIDDKGKASKSHTVNK